MKKYYFLILLGALFLSAISANGQSLRSYDFSAPEPLKLIGRGTCAIKEGVFRSKDACACFGNPEWKDYSFSFKARAPKEADQVQIWAGFRAYSRFDRYVLGIKGGLQDDLYLMRMGYMGTDELLDIRPLDFHPTPGTWYCVKVEVCKGRIRIFLGDEELPRIDVTDANYALAPSGEVTLGGGWIETEFDDLVITPMSENQLANVAVKEYAKLTPAQDKEEKRKLERKQYKPVKVTTLSDSRMDVSLDGEWLFMPEYQLSDSQKAISSSEDSDWHVMSVPDFWNPIRIWLHGETMGQFPKGVSDTYYQQETARCENYTFNYKMTKAAWYRQWVELPAGVEGKNMELTFDAVSKVAEIYINGQMAASHIGMFGEIKVDGSQLLKPGNNLVVVKVTRDFIKDISDADKIVDVAVTVPVTNKMLKDIAHGFYGDDPAGIWQPVKLTITHPVKVEDVFIKPTLSGATFDITVKNHFYKKSSFKVYTDIVDKETGSTLYSALSLSKVALNGGEEKVFTYDVANLKPRLWSPQHPNLYDFKFRIVASDGKELDAAVITSGFRTFEVKDGLFFLNGHRYWLRGGNHTPFALAPNDLNLANTFYQLMKKGNMDVTRTHTTPYNKLWMGAADVNGVGISFEGTWPWLMIHGSMPDKKLIEMWKEEFLELLKKYRNHPSLLFWTVNNEMKFYDNDSDLERAKVKYQIISDVVKEMRKIDPTRPVCFDSNYQRKGKELKYGADFMASVDDGDIDDVHSYINWYDHTIFKYFNGEFQKGFKMPNRPLISQEMSTGYPNNETGHPTRSYQLLHQNPQTLIGYESYDFANPESFLKVQSFITGELAEALRRSNDQASGILHFALLTWFREVYDSKKIDPYPTYYALQRAMQPVLVSAELWGRHFYAGESLPTRIYVVNDREDGSTLKPTLLRWEIKDESGKKWSWGEEELPEVKHYQRHWFAPTIQLPANLPTEKANLKLVLRLTENGLPVSANEYDLLVAQRSWNTNRVASEKSVVLLDNKAMKPVFDGLGIPVQTVSSVAEALKRKADVCVLAGLTAVTTNEKELIRTYISNGGKLLFLHSKEAVKEIYPEHITGWIIPTEGDIATMELTESPVFDGIDALELRYFNTNKREIPTVCDAALQVNRSKHIVELANQTKIHGYVDGTMEVRSHKVKTIKGFPLFKIVDNGEAIVSSMSVEKAATDPIAGKLLVNMIHDLAK